MVGDYVFNAGALKRCSILAAFAVLIYRARATTSVILFFPTILFNFVDLALTYPCS